jgi:hypothetical protein
MTYLNLVEIKAGGFSFSADLFKYQFIVYQEFFPHDSSLESDIHISGACFTTIALVTGKTGSFFLNFSQLYLAEVIYDLLTAS